MLRFLFWYLLAVNLLSYLVFWLDKRRAEKQGKRVSERELLLWCLAGGTVGAFAAMRRYRHKTKKKGFQVGFWLIVAGQLVGLWFLVKY